MKVSFIENVSLRSLKSGFCSQVLTLSTFETKTLLVVDHALT